MIPDLIAFLSPTRIAVPPLRERVEDIEGLIHFFSMSRGVQDPVERLAPEALESLRHYHWPRNTEELEMTVAFILHKRPSGLIRPEDLPSTIGGQTDHYLKLLDLLEEILVDEGFRRVAALEGRLRLARFLTEHAGEPFRASEIQNLFAIGRETARRLLKTLESHGLIRGIKGATQRRTTRYRLNSLP
jgi:DNA-binding NtrC family response regulator